MSALFPYAMSGSRFVVRALTHGVYEYSIPVTLTFEQATGKNVLLLPMGSSTDAAHSINEKLDRRNYIEGTKLLGAYLHYVAEEPMSNGA